MRVPGMQCIQVSDSEALVTVAAGDYAMMSSVPSAISKSEATRLGLGATRPLAGALPPRRTSSYRAARRAASSLPGGRSFSELDRSSRYATVLTTIMSESQLPIFDPIMPGDTLETSPETGVGGDLEGEFYG
jgi:hypothetical protein